MSKSATTTTFPRAGPRDATEPFDIMAQHRVACMAGVPRLCYDPKRVFVVAAKRNT